MDSDVIFGDLAASLLPQDAAKHSSVKGENSFQYFAWHSLQRVVVSVGFHPIVDFGYRNVWQFPMDAFGCFNEMKWNGHRTDMMEWI